MATDTSIEWADKTWSPIIGCDRVSPGCDACYAINTARIRESNPHPAIAAAFAGTTQRTDNGIDWSGRVNLLDNRLTEPLRWKKPRKVFVNSLSDLFHKAVPTKFIAKVFAVMALTPQHTYQVLTKRHGRMRSLLNETAFVDAVREQMYALDAYATLARGALSTWPLPGVWLGVSVEDQKRADLRIPALVDTPAAVRFLSCEPLLGPVDLTAWMPTGHASWRCQGPDCRRFYSGPLQQHCPDCGREGYWTGSHTGNGRPNGQPIGWVIAGGESGRGARPMSPDWARSIRDQAQAAGVPYLFKQWGEYAPTGYMAIGAREKGCVFVGDPIDDLGHRWEMRRLGKKAAGRELDGRTWDQFPAVTQ